MIDTSDIKKLGFGLMRLPQKDGKIDVEQTKEMVDLFLDAGFKYFDTAWAYAGSEEAIKEALVDRYPRDSYYLATKLAAWINCKTKEEAQKQFYTSLERAGVDYFDFYLLHNLGENRTKFFDDFDLWSFVQDLKKEGKIKHVGFSFHSTADELEELLSKHPEIEFVQLQINYVDWDDYAVQSRKCYEVVRKHGKQVVIMEPVKGGMLANPPKTIEEIFKKASDASCASWAIKFAANLEGVITVLSGMSNLEQMKDNLSYMKDFNGLTKEEMDVLDKAQKAYNEIPLIPCTTCNYCAKVCPKNIGISGSFTALNQYTIYGDLKYAKRREGWLVGSHGKASANECIQCGMCETVCPQHISIREELEKVVKVIL